MKIYTVIGSAGCALSLGVGWNPGEAKADCLDAYFAYGQESLVLGDRTHVGALTIGSESYLEVGAAAQVHAKAAASQLHLRSQALLNGAAYTYSSVSKQAGAIQTGPTLDFATAPACEAPALPAVSPGGEDRHILVTERLEPGHYGHVAVGVGATLLVGGGDYHFTSLSFEPDTQLLAQWTGEPARLLISDALYWGDRHEQVSARPRAAGASVEALEVWTLQGEQLRIGTDSRFVAQIVAPYAELVVASRSELLGSLYAARVRTEPDVTLGRFVHINPVLCGEED